MSEHGRIMISRVRWYLLPLASLVEGNRLDIAILLKLEEADCIIFSDSAGDAVDALEYNSFLSGSLQNSLWTDCRAVLMSLREGFAALLPLLEVQPSNK